MNGLLMTPNCAEPDTLDVFCKRLMAALGELKVRLQAQYERRFPGEGSRIRMAIDAAEEAAWQTGFPHLFLPDLAEKAIARRAVPLNSEPGEETGSFPNVAELSKAQGSMKSKILNQYHGNGFFVSVFWLSPQVCFLPCCWRLGK
jgi:hypothetical protein